MDLKVKLDTRKLRAWSSKTRKRLDDLNDEALEKFKDLTPIDTGRARKNTRLKERNDKATIEGRYPYAQRLDKGWSRQAPEGMTKPFADWWKKRVKQIVRK